MWSELGRPHLFHQWECLKCNGHGPSISSVKYLQGRCVLNNYLSLNYPTYHVIQNIVISTRPWFNTLLNWWDVFSRLDFKFSLIMALKFQHMEAFILKLVAWPMNTTHHSSDVMLANPSITLLSGVRVFVLGALRIQWWHVRSSFLVRVSLCKVWAFHSYTLGPHINKCTLLNNVMKLLLMIFGTCMTTLITIFVNLTLFRHFETIQI